MNTVLLQIWVCVHSRSVNLWESTDSSSNVLKSRFLSKLRVIIKIKIISDLFLSKKKSRTGIRMILMIQLNYFITDGKIFTAK